MTYYFFLSYLCLVPGPVMKFETKERGSNHMGMQWEPPAAPNGILLGYTLTARQGQYSILLGYTLTARQGQYSILLGYTLTATQGQYSIGATVFRSSHYGLKSLS